MNKIIDIAECEKLIKSGDSIMVGGFLGVGSPIKTIERIAKSHIKDLTLISVVACAPGGDFDIGKLTKNGKVKKMIAAHIGTDPEIARLYKAGLLEVELNPMGTLIERIRSAGAGLGGILTPTGIGTEIEKDAKKITIDGKDFLFYKPLRANVAIVKAHRADKAGNLEYSGASVNTNPIIATAADIVIAEVDEIVEVGSLDPLKVATPEIFIDYIVPGYSVAERKEIYSNLWVERKLV